MANLFEPIINLKRVGETKAKAYAKLDIETPYDLLFHYPRSYADFTSPVDIADIKCGEVNVIRAFVKAKYPPRFIKRNLTVYTALLRDSTGDINLVIYNVPYAFNNLKVGMEYCFAGKVTLHGSGYEILAPKIIDSDSNEKILPIYHLTTGLSIYQVRENVKDAIKLMREAPFEWMPFDILNKYDLCPLTTAIEKIHFPNDISDIETARKRLAFDEMLRLQLGMLMLKKRNKNTTAYTIDSKTDIKEFLNSLPFTPTDGQMSAINEIKSDMQSGFPMNRLLQGDVGSGKTCVAAAACFMAYKNNMQSALMAPTEILAVQHYKTFTSFLGNFGINIVLLTSSLTAKEKKAVHEKILTGEADIIIGTNAIMQKKVDYNNLGLVITDEQHRFGVEQRNALSGKSKSPHKLVMSATPIPRTLALMMYGELELSIIKELPKGRQPIETFAVTGKLRNRAFNFIAKEINNKHQCYIICPLVEDSEKMDDKKSVLSYTEKLKSIFPEFSINYLHGRMSAQDKDKVMAQFKDGNIDILVSTTVVEVGVDVPNATVMMIEDAERFGMSQLHQLRGRVGRGNCKSYCILVTDNATEDAKKRLKTLSSTNDGFKIAEEDLAQRGAGDFFGNRQHGLPPLKIADLSKDLNLFQMTREAAENIIKADPELLNTENRALRLEVMRLFAKSGQNDLN